MSIENASDWLTPGVNLFLGEYDIHVWRAYLLLPESQQQRVWQLLTPEEQQRAQSFRFEQHRLRWSTARGVLRHLLSFYTQSEPQTIHLKHNAYGKPALALPQTARPLMFNISHSHDYALYAFAYQRELGVDIEQMRTNIELDDLANHCFSALEQATYATLPSEQKVQGFYQCWTRKEAYIKARGMGLSLPLKLFDVTLRPDEPAHLIASREDVREVERWQLYNLQPATGYAGALFVERPENIPCHLSCWQWNSSLLKTVQ